MDEVKHRIIIDLDTKYKCEHEGYEYYKKSFIEFGEAEQAKVAVYEIPPLKSAYPYHYHHKNEETFYIISGNGILKTPQGYKKVEAGELIFFPNNCNGSHKLTNSSSTENLMYIDFSVVHDIDVAVYPDSNKIAIWGKGTNTLFKQDSEVVYYEDE